MKGDRALLRIPTAFAVASIGLALFAATTAARWAGWLEAAELAAADALMAARAAPAQGDRAVTVVLMTEEDVVARGWPLSDGVLAQALERIAAMGPAAIGVDIYRDRPEGEGAAALAAVLAREASIVWVTKFPSAGGSGVEPPAPLIETERRGFADMIEDEDGVVRRALLFLDDGERFEMSFALAVAAPYLAARGVALAGSRENPDALALGDATLEPFAGDEGPYAGADDAGYQIPLDYARGLDVAATITLSDVLEGRATTDLIAGRIVLLGAGAETVKDDFIAPIRGRTDGVVYGVALHAAIVDQLLRHGLDGAPRQRALGAVWEQAWILAAALAGAALGGGVRSPARLLGGAAALGGGQAALAYGVFAAFLWPPIVPAGIASAGAAGAGAVYAAWRQRHERRSLMSLFSRHVSGEVAERIWSDRAAFLSGGAPRPQRLTATVLFSDIRGFTPISERLDEEALMAWLNDYMTEMAAAVIETGGVIDKYIGDAIMAVWGAPAARKTEREIDADARAAASCALAMAERLAALNRRSAAAGLPAVGMRVGVHTGPLVAGSLGSRERLEYTVIGDTVNVAARLESAANALFEGEGAPNVAIAVSEATRARLGPGFETRPMGALTLKGKSGGTEAHALIGGPAAKGDG